jgi:cell division protein FtsB
VRKLPRLSAAPAIAIAVLLAVGYLGFNTARYVVHNYQLHQEEDGVRAQIDQLDRDHEQLVAVRDYLKSDEYVEDVARRILGLVRPGETLVVVSGADPAPGAAATATPGARATAGAPWWKELFGDATPAPTPGAP